VKKKKDQRKVVFSRPYRTCGQSLGEKKNEKLFWSVRVRGVGWENNDSENKGNELVI